MHPNANRLVVQDQYMIFSCHAPEFMTKCLEANGIDYKVVEGCYKGEREPAYIVNRKHEREIKFMLKGDQESILFLDEVQKDGTRGAKLIFLKDGHLEKLGRFKPVDADVAAQHDAWTFRPDQNQYYVCE